MEKKETIELYVAPEVEVLEVQVEKGFAATYNDGGVDPGIGGYPGRTTNAF